MRVYTSEEIREFVSRPSFDGDVLLKKDLSYPRISIVTPSFNQGQFLERTILSVLNQNYPNLEYVIIDGGSTDESVEIIRKYEKYLYYWISERDGGQSDALNKGFHRTAGHLVGWQNSDDIYLPGAFYHAAEVFTKAPDIDIAFANRLDVDEEDNIIGESRFTRFSLMCYWYEGMSVSNQSAFWRRELFERIGLIDSNLHVAMDYEFFLRASLKGSKFKHVRSYWGAIRRHTASKANTLWAALMAKECDVIDERFGKRNYLKVPCKVYSSIRRSLYYFLQGDSDYLWRGMKRRIGVLLGPFFRLGEVAVSRDKELFTTRDYWEDRLQKNWGLHGVGYLGYGTYYNKWLYRVRKIIFNRHVRPLIRNPLEAKVLDIGSGTGFYLDLWKRVGVISITGSDIASVAVKHLKESYPELSVLHLDICKPIEQQGFGSGAFDIVSAFDVLFHIADDSDFRHALFNISRLLKRGGYLIFSDNFIHGKSFRTIYQVHRSIEEITEVLQEAGFRVVERTPMFVLMNAPLDTANRFPLLLWRIVMAPVRLINWVGLFYGAIVFPIEACLIRIVKEGPSTELMVCQKEK